MKSLIVVSLVGASVLLGLPAGAQQMPPPYAPPVPPQLQQPQVQQVPDEAGRRVAAADGRRGVCADRRRDPTRRYEFPNSPTAVDYPPADLGPDNEIAQSYDDGYDAQAYTQFQTALAPYGGWDYDSSYGYVWSPSVSIVGAGFSPYGTGGNWALTEYGWTWVSDFNWGWAPFHYGRWITRAGRWSWVPGSMWGPAWVSWRSGGGYVGWSPLPPRGVRLAGGYGARSPWRFAPAASLGAGRPTFVSSRYLPGMFARTTVVSNDRLLTRGNWSVHVNAGPTRGITARPVSLSRAAPSALPRVAVYPHPGVSLNAPPWTRTPEARGRRSDAGVARGHAGRAAAHRRARARVRLEPDGACGGPRAVGQLVAAAGAGLRERRRLRPSIQQRMVGAGAAPVIWRTERLRRPERVSRAGERVPRPRPDARVPCPGAGARVPRPCAGARLPSVGAVLQPTSPVVCASFRAAFQRRFRPLRLVVGRRQPLRSFGRRPLRRLRRWRASPLTAVDALSPPRYQGSLGRLTQRKSATFTRWKP